MTTRTRTMHPLFLDEPARRALWARIVDVIESYAADVAELKVQATPEPGAIESLLEKFTFDEPVDVNEALDTVSEALRTLQTHPAHPRYFGLFNPAPASMGIAGDVLASAFNTQLAAWSHAPFAVQAEQHVVRSIGRRFGSAFQYGNFTSGGAEANLTALIIALTDRFSAYGSGGLRALSAQPTLYVSAAAHHSFVKAARITGLGTDALRVIPCDAELTMDTNALVRTIHEDRARGCVPFLVVGTAGATATGVVEPLDDIARIAQDERLWFHVDAAWGGFAAFIPELAGSLHGVAQADSITFDPHKMLSVPLGSGLLLTRHRDVLGRAFAVTANYMPAHEGDGDRADPFTHSMQWSRRFIGLKVLLSLAVAGWNGYAQVLRRQVQLGHTLRTRLANAGWHIVNETPFPVVCFVPSKPAADLSSLAEAVQRSGEAWISVAILPDGTPVLRACITNYRTDEGDVDALVQLLGCS